MAILFILIIFPAFAFLIAYQNALSDYRSKGIATPGLFDFMYVYKPFESWELNLIYEIAPGYKKLNTQEQKRFRHKVRRFGMQRTWKGKKGMEISPKKELVISILAVQVIFKFSEVKLRHFTRIILFPKAFLSGHSPHLHKGELHTNGAIVLSWEDVVKDLEKNDGYNVGLHELAHALRIENMIDNGEYEFLDENVTKQLRKQYEIFKSKPTEEGSVLRRYARANFEEFFAVATEAFFERNQDLKIHFPKVHQLMKQFYDLRFAQ